MIRTVRVVDAWQNHQDERQCVFCKQVTDTVYYPTWTPVCSECANIQNETSLIEQIGVVNIKTPVLESREVKFMCRSCNNWTSIKLVSRYEETLINNRLCLSCSEKQTAQAKLSHTRKMMEG